MIMELNTVYEKSLGDMSHCGESHEEMIEHYNGNSSPLSFLLEKKLPKWFDNLVYDTTRHVVWCEQDKITIMPDLRDKETHTILYDQKIFNHKGGSFKRSNSKGIGRSYNKRLNEAWASEQIFIWTEVLDLPKVKIIALSGNECYDRFPTATIALNQREKLFSE